MAKYQLGFIGTGNMGGALVRAACKQNAAQVLIFDNAAEKAQALAAECGCKAAPDAETLAAQAAYVVIGVKPHNVAGLMATLEPVLSRRDDVVVVSMAAGVSIAKLKAMTTAPIIRIMPNTPAASGEGLTLVCAEERVTQAQIDAFTAAMAQAGLFDELPESLFDAAGTLSGCGPAWVYQFIEALADGAVACGVPRDKAMRYAEQMVRGAATHAMTTGAHPGALKDAVCSPGGSTIVGVAALERSGFRAAVIDAVCASYDKTVLMGR